VAVLIKEVLPSSIAEEMEIEAGDMLLGINGHDINDILDYNYWVQDDQFAMDIRKPNGETWTLEIEKDYDEKVGLVFAGAVFDRLKTCRNRCLFCFVDQLPMHMRKSLYVKDDDYRYSFLYGNFITLTNLSPQDWDKILSMRLSPLYVSVHCMRPALRAEMLGNPRAADIEEGLRRLAQADIQIHTQVVLCPGVNDGLVLEETIERLTAYHPSVQSVGIVPIGLTGHRRGLSSLRAFTAAEAADLIENIDHKQEGFRNRWGEGFVYLADEFYVLAGRAFPPAEYYDDYSQTENGIGLARIFLDEFAELKPFLPGRIAARSLAMVTGFSALPVLNPVVKELNKIKGLGLELIPVRNRYFGGNVSVTGLLTGQDILEALGDKQVGKEVILPAVVLRESSEVLLDDRSVGDLERESGCRILVVDGSARSLVEAVLGQGLQGG